jgi:polar amino acid transport system permease protein
VTATEGATGTAPSVAPRGRDTIKAIPLRRPGRWVATVVVLVLLGLLVSGLSTSKNLEWGTVGKYFTTSAILQGLVRTIEITVIAMAIGIVLGIVLAVMRLSPVPLVSGGSWLYIWFFRGTPVLVQLIFWFNVAALIGQHPAIGIPFTHIVFFHFTTNTFATAFVAAILGLGLNEGAYMAEIVRAGILSVDEGQTEAAHSIGMTRLKTMRLIVLPQAMRVIVPPTGNETISMLKTSSLASVIAFPELLGTAQIIYGRTFQTIPLLIVASLWYLIMTSVLTFGQFYVERHFARGSSRQLPPTPLQRLRALFTANVTRFHRPPPPIAVMGREHR